MTMFATIFSRTTMTLFTVVVFFNMNFFLAEVEALDLLKDRKMMQNIARLVAGASNEEEKDFAGGGSEGDSVIREIDFIFSQVLFPFSAFTHVSSIQYGLAGSYNLLTRSTDTLCQPPEA